MRIYANHLAWTRCDAWWNKEAVCIELNENGTLTTDVEFTGDTVSAAQEYWYYSKLLHSRIL